MELIETIKKELEYELKQVELHEFCGDKEEQAYYSGRRYIIVNLIEIIDEWEKR